MTSAMEIVITAQLKLVYSSMHMIFILSCGRLFSSGAIRDDWGDQSVALLHGAGVDDQEMVKMDSKTNFPISSLTPSTVQLLLISFHGDKTWRAAMAMVYNFEFMYLEPALGDEYKAEFIEFRKCRL
jgi:hypothetical protein